PETLIAGLTRLQAYMNSPETHARADAEKERQPGRVGPESFKGAFLGARTKDGEPTGGLCVVAMVDKKADKGQIADAARLDRLPAHRGADREVPEVAPPRTGDGDVTFRGPFAPQLGYQPQPPVWCGGSVGPANPASTGTFGSLAAAANDAYF